MSTFCSSTMHCNKLMMCSLERGQIHCVWSLRRANVLVQVGNLSLSARFNGSPQQHPTPYSLASSHGSMGSFGSYGEGPAFDNFDSHIDGPGLYPVGTNGQASVLGGSPDSGWRGRPPVPVLAGVGHTQLGMSPSSGRNFGSLSLGASPSQFTAAGPLFQLSPGSYIASPGSFPSSPASSFLPSPGSPSQQGSPNRFGPTSPARGQGGLRETAVGNANAAHGHFHRRRQFQAQVAAPPSAHGPLQQDLAQWARLQHSSTVTGNMEANTNFVADGHGGPRRGPPPMPHSRSVRNGSTTGLAQLQRVSSYGPDTLGTYLSQDISTDGPEEESIADPHWDPNFR